MCRKRVRTRMDRASAARRPSGPNAGVVIAVLLVVGVVVVGGGLGGNLLRGGGGEGGVSSGVDGVVRSGTASIQRVHGGGGEALWSVPVFASGEVMEEGAMSDAAALLGDEGVLVLARRGNGALARSEWGPFAGLVGRLERDGVRVGGDGMEEGATEAVAGLLAGVGAGGIGDAEERAWVDAWLSENEEWAAALWLEAGEGERSRVVVGQDEVAEAAVRRSLEAWRVRD